jgi:signal transduction histidine kinase
VWVQGNAPAIADAVRNLVENAVYHTRVGTEVTVAVSAAGAVTVADCGPGIAEADRKRIFERFWRGRDVRRRGAGLGLAIVAEILKVHQGEIQVMDAPGGGALFLMRFPDLLERPATALAAHSARGTSKETRGDISKAV